MRQTGRKQGPGWETPAASREGGGGAWPVPDPRTPACRGSLQGTRRESRTGCQKHSSRPARKAEPRLLRLQSPGKRGFCRKGAWRAGGHSPDLSKDKLLGWKAWGTATGWKRGSR